MIEAVVAPHNLKHHLGNSTTQHQYRAHQKSMYSFETGMEIAAYLAAGNVFTLTFVDHKNVSVGNKAEHLMSIVDDRIYGPENISAVGISEAKFRKPIIIKSASAITSAGIYPEANPTKNHGRLHGFFGYLALLLIIPVQLAWIAACVIFLWKLYDWI